MKNINEILLKKLKNEDYDNDFLNLFMNNFSIDLVEILYHNSIVLNQKIVDYILSNFDRDNLVEILFYSYQHYREKFQNICDRSWEDIINYVIMNNKNIYNISFLDNFLEYYKDRLTSETLKKTQNIVSLSLVYSKTYSCYQLNIISYLGLNWFIEELNNNSILYNNFIENCNLSQILSYITSFASSCNYDINDVLYLIDITLNAKVTKISNDVLIRIMDSAITPINEIKYRNTIKKIYDNVDDIKLLFKLMTRNNNIYEIFTFCNFFSCIFDKKTEFYFIKKLKNKQFNYINLLEDFYNEYNFQYESNKQYVKGLIFMKKIKV